MHTARHTIRNLALALCGLLLSAGAHATSVMEVGLDEMLDQSALVFEGRVVDTETRELGNGMIQTRVTFEVLDVIKGPRQNDYITLGFLGGMHGDRQTRVAQMRMPEAGEHGIYFAEAPGRNLVHPLYGWSQGHFTVTRDINDVERVMTAGGRPVAAIERAQVIPPGLLSKGVARGLRLGQGGMPAALDKQTFKQQLRERLP